VLISSPLAGAWADRRGSRTLAAGGMVVTAVGLAGMTMLQAERLLARGGVDAWRRSRWSARSCR
jgi:MFS family permease